MEAGPPRRVEKYRTDEDSLGPVRVPAGAYWGPFTQRALAQYTATGRPPHPDLINAFVMIKRSAAAANEAVGVLDAKRGRAIRKACDAALAGRLDGQFAVDAVNSGAGTALNMNVNEVLANAALESMGKKKGQYTHLHPNDHVNMSQSSNDTFPTAMHVSVLVGINKVLPATAKLASSLRRKARQFAGHKKIGRTHLMDALPVTLGGEFAAYATAVSRASASLEQSSKELRGVALGGTAVGTGANAPRGYRKRAVAELARVSGLPLSPEKDMQYGLQSRFAVAAASSALRNLAVEIGRVASDVRLMASGPLAGLSEIGIPAVHAGSSIMPGKVNPSLAESMNMVCFGVIGNDAAVVHAAAAGQFELNVMLPGMLRAVLDSTDMLSNFVPVFAANLIDGLSSDKKRLRADVERSPVMVTLLAPRIGYQKAAALFKESLATGKTVRELALEKKLMSPAELGAALE